MFADEWSNAIIASVDISCEVRKGYELFELEVGTFGLICRCGNDSIIAKSDHQVNAVCVYI